MSIWGDVRDEPKAPVALSPQAASEGAADSSGGPGLGVDFFLSLGASLGSLAESLQADRDRREDNRPADRSLYVAGTASAAGLVQLDLGSVPQGRVWQVRRLVVGGVAVTTSAGGQAYAFARGAPPTDLALSDVVDIFSTLPQGNTYGTHQLFLVPSEHLWVVFSGATSGQQYAAAARVEDYDADAFDATYSE